MDNLYIPKWITIMCYITEGNLHRISRKLDITHSYTVKVVNLLVKRGYLKKEKKDKRENRYVYTRKGKELRKMCEDIISEVKGFDVAPRY